MVVNEHSVPGGGRPLDQRRDLVVLEDKAYVTKAVLLQCQRSLERSTKAVDVLFGTAANMTLILYNAAICMYRKNQIISDLCYFTISENITDGQQSKSQVFG